ncbi:MAG: bifunctional tRNA (5-methylaminomethyl-2-thiouridine)(34)-methyltransferase MnmD/FAD-dependent 5-carboxymethylaminomethyl-2-thiouridine(34) oxidoreductase MnmC [Alteromonadaceae bacterium]|nr:bifunctional tRNA (5-methylaminomethyl-2-thiouridine)(34)-methyltransferase MnmD/FAD-dependent 5-carboxymethylaminomethyl-2-thiouridine(34) oxidoreductase MnmC [Alteromonadaceae bacterium]
MDYANIQFNEAGVPVSTEFDDVYFSNENGLKESNYVFYQNNGVDQRLPSFQDKSFIVFETGFGTGLNFLNTWQNFLRIPLERRPTLHFISCEKFPVAPSTLKEALAFWTSLSHLSNQLIKVYPMAIEGCHRLEFDNGKVILDLWFADVEQVLQELVLSDEHPIDAWYLDGFAPSKNPEMWSESLFKGMAKHSGERSTFATFTAAGFVRRGLQAVGFEVNKVKGFGHKREMLSGRFKLSSTDTRHSKNDFHQQVFSHGYVSPSKIKRVAIIGAGLAGANLAFSLTRRGFNVQLYTKDADIAQGASGNSQGGFYPHLTADFSRQSQLYTCAFEFAKQRYQDLQNAGFEFEHDYCGVLLAGFSEEVKKRQNKLSANKCWPNELIAPVTSAQAAQKLGLTFPYDGMWIEQGGWINPSSLCRALVAAAKQTSRLTVLENYELSEYQQYDEHCSLNFKNGQSANCDVLIFAEGSGFQQRAQENTYPMQVVRGQVESVTTNDSIQGLRSVLCHKGYFCPAHQGQHALGATFVKDDSATDIRAEDSAFNLKMIKSALNDCEWVHDIHDSNHARASIRATFPDHLPIADAIAVQKSLEHALLRNNREGLEMAKTTRYYGSNIYALVGLGSRGLCTAPILSEAIACQINGEPMPLGRQLLATVSSVRFAVKQQIKVLNSQQ